MCKYFIIFSIVKLDLDSSQKCIICNVYDIFCFAKKVFNAVMVDLLTVIKTVHFLLSKKIHVKYFKYQELMQKLCKFAQIIFRSWILHNWMVGLLKRKISWFITALIPETVGTGPNAPVIAYLYKMAKTSSHIFLQILNSKIEP